MLNSGPVILAHRGGAHETIENTWSALEHMRAAGLTQLETDAHATADGVVVLHHDPDLKRMAGRPERIRDLTWDRLRRIRDISGNPLVRLDEALAAFPEMDFNIDAKDTPVVEPLARLTRGHTDRIVLASFSSARLAQLSRLVPGARRSLGMREVGQLRALAAALPAGALPRVHRVRAGQIAVQVPERYGPLAVTTPRFIAACHALGIEVHVWTVDDPARARTLVQAGVDGVVTNVPTAVRDTLTQLGPVRA